MRVDSRRTDRGTSITISHVMTIGITTLLIAMLLTSAGGLLETETQRSAESSLETIGERLAGQIDGVDRMAAGDDGRANVTADHPRTVVNSGYRVEFLNRTACESAPLLEGSNDCLRLTASDVDAEVYVPVATEAPLDDGRTVSGGSLEVYVNGDGDITIRRAEQ